ncbi:MAG: hypothetical protein J7K66_02680 [Anaerolineaceae bacterium]|nr:hypothetical protein [Anaerolineaceae bacterium]
MSNKGNSGFLFALLVGLAGGIMLFSACGNAEIMEVREKSQPSLKEEKSELSPEADESIPKAEEATDISAADPQKVKFTTSDDVELNGVFYPAGSISAPLIILMHWAPGDQDDWVEIAYWLQNRGLGGHSVDGKNTPWLNPSWFPVVESGESYNVLTFTFRNCENGCKKFEREKWYLDVQTAVEFAYELEGVDKDRIIMIGASIGSDGAADGCAYLNQIHPNACKGALSFSPGNYLTIDYREIVKELGAGGNPKPVWCLYAESDIESESICGNITDNNFTSYSYSKDMIFSNGHGMNLIAPNQDPDPLVLVLKFLAVVS